MSVLDWLTSPAEFLLYPAFLLVLAAIMLVGMAVTQRTVPITWDRRRGILNVAIVVVASTAAVLVVAYLNCAFFIDLPFGNEVCRLMGF